MSFGQYIKWNKSSYNVSSANVVFSEAPGTNSSIDIVTLTPTLSNTANSAAAYANAAFETANNSATTGKAIAMSIVFG